jgi:hypothetical protein
VETRQNARRESLESPRTHRETAEIPRTNGPFPSQKSPAVSLPSSAQSPLSATPREVTSPRPYASKAWSTPCAEAPPLVPVGCAAIAEGHRRSRSWVRGHPGRRNEAWFKREIAPKLDAFSLREIGKATGLSLAACSRIRAGAKVPHPRHWDRLLALIHC